jgi:hypothetical protein
MKTRLIGDIHGKWLQYQNVISNPNDACSTSIQIGDFGWGFGQRQEYVDQTLNFMNSGNHRFIRGNHDNPEVCRTIPGYIEDGTVEGDTMFIGGAWSIDNPNAGPGWYRRSEGYDWWPDEQCNDEQFEKFIDTYSKVKPKIMVTHDCPKSVSAQLFDIGTLHKPYYPNRTAEAFQIMFEIHQPERWYFGHWHIDAEMMINGTMFQCISELNHTDVQL